MKDTLVNTTFEFSGQREVYYGKVRDVYNIENRLLVMVASDRISAFDHILPRGIPYKGQVLNQLAARFLERTSDIVPNWLLDTPDPNVSVGKICTPYPVEMVVRGYLAGHAWREYRSGKRELCGVALPEGLKENDPLPQPIITPTTKAREGHDEDISREAILEQQVVAPEVYKQMEDHSLRLFQRGTEIADERGLILVDTKYEFGDHEGQLTLIDEIHTPDSSRYFYKEGFAERQRNGEKQQQLSKEFVRQWLIEKGFQGLEGQDIPEMTDEIVERISERYIGLYESITGESFERADLSDVPGRVRKNVTEYLREFV